METIYVTFQIGLQDSEYSYHSTAHAETELKLEVDLDTLKALEASAVFAAMLKTAIGKFEKELAGTKAREE